MCVCVCVCVCVCMCIQGNYEFFQLLIFKYKTHTCTWKIQVIFRMNIFLRFLLLFSIQISNEFNRINLEILRSFHLK